MLAEGKEGRGDEKGARERDGGRAVGNERRKYLEGREVRREEGGTGKQMEEMEGGRGEM